MSSTWEDFRNEVFDCARVYGQPRIANHEIAKLDTFLLRELRRFCAETKCLYSGNVAFTVNTTPGGYFDMRDTDYFALPMLEIRRVVINSNVLPGPSPRSGVWTLEQLELSYPNYLTAAAGTPQLAVQVNPKTLLLFPYPSATISNCWVSGWYLHPEKTNEQTELSLNEEDESGAVYHCAAELILPQANGGSTQKVGELMALAKDRKADVRSRAEKLLSTLDQRGPYRNTRHRL